MRSSNRDLSAFALEFGDDHSVSSEVAFKELVKKYREVADWYMDEKRSKSRISKRLRAIAVALGVAGGISPIVSVFASQVNSYVGYGLLGLAGGVQLIDRYFGFSASWTRCLATGMELSSKALQLQFDWHLNVAKGVSEVERWTMLKEYSETLGATVRLETQAWRDDLAANLGSVESSSSTREYPIV